eukprot:GHVS01002030.1.p1 GENE.GHVS01002030.1~~GHVS01002030.1.p1  ORF type:complete len:282 (-),score=15.34 GHVS01002030.1:153-923(-)
MPSEVLSHVLNIQSAEGSSGTSGSMTFENKGPPSVEVGVSPPRKLMKRKEEGYGETAVIEKPWTNSFHALGRPLEGQSASSLDGPSTSQARQTQPLMPTNASLPQQNEARESRPPMSHFSRTQSLNTPQNRPQEGYGETAVIAFLPTTPSTSHAPKEPSYTVCGSTSAKRKRSLMLLFIVLAFIINISLLLVVKIGVFPPPFHWINLDPTLSNTAMKVITALGLFIETVCWLGLLVILGHVLCRAAKKYLCRGIGP